MKLTSVLTAFLLTFALSPFAQAQVSESGCNLELRNAFGPFDYRTATEEQRRIVEINHFTGQVENLIRGITGPIGGDLDYTLRVFPNHPRALMAIAKLARREGKPRPTGSHYSAQCWFERALEFQPEDPQVRLVYGIDLLRDNKAREAIEQMLLAEKLLGADANVAYNLGLAYFEMKDYEQALKRAHQAYALGFPLPGLREKLHRVGQWREADKVAPVSATPAAAATSPTLAPATSPEVVRQ